MSANTHRRWLRLHLSTALFTSLVAGALLWANVPMQEIVMKLDDQQEDYEFRVSFRGWPFFYRTTAFTKRRLYSEIPKLLYYFRNNQTGTLTKITESEAERVFEELRSDTYHRTLDAFVAAGILMGSYVVSETLVRRRKRVPCE